MLGKIDAALVAWCDSAGIWLQRRGWSLLVVKLAFVTLCFGSVVSTTLALDGLGWALVVTLLLSPELWKRWSQHKRYGDYFEVVSKMRRLNSGALWMRALPGVRAFSAGVAGLWMMVLVAHNERWPLALSWIVFGVVPWLDCATFIGPGEFGRQKQERHHTAWQGAS